MGSASYSCGNPPDAEFTGASCRRWNGFPTRNGPACWWSCAARRRAPGRDGSVCEPGIVRGRKTKYAPMGLWEFTAGLPALDERSHQQPWEGPSVFPLCSRGWDWPACAPRTPDATPIPALTGRKPAKATFSAAAPTLRRRRSRSKPPFQRLRYRRPCRSAAAATPGPVSVGEESDPTASKRPARNISAPAPWHRRLP